MTHEPLPFDDKSLQLRGKLTKFPWLVSLARLQTTAILFVTGLRPSGQHGWTHGDLRQYYATAVLVTSLIDAMYLSMTMVIRETLDLTVPSVTNLKAKEPLA